MPARGTPASETADAPVVGPRRALVRVVDDDASVRTALARLLRADGYDVELFATAADLLARGASDRPTCLVVDVRMPDVDGLALQERLRTAGHEPAIVFLTGYGDVATTVRAMKGGAIDFLEKPLDSRALIAAIERALARDASAHAERREREHLTRRYALLTAREREVLALVASGFLNRVVAERLGASEKTVKVHRGRVMAKMAAGSLAELVRMASKLDIATEAAAAR